MSSSKKLTKPKKKEAMEYTNYMSRTFFIVIHRKSLENMGIDLTEWDKGDKEWDLSKVKEDIYTALQDAGGQHYGTICKSADGCLHIHDVCTFEKPKRRRAAANLFGKAHTEEMRGTKEQADDYINKRDKFEEKGEIILATYGNKDAIETNARNQGKRTDLEAFDILVLNGTIKSLDKYLLENPEIEEKAQERIFRGRFNRLMKYKASQFRDVEVYYVEGASRNGKSLRIFEEYQKEYADSVFKVNTDEKSAFPFDGYDGQEVLWLDELRPGLIKPAQLFQILDGYPYSVNVKGDHSFAQWTKVYITTACPLDEWFKKTEDIKNTEMYDNYRIQFLKRIKYHIIAFMGSWWEVPKRIEKYGAIEIPRYSSKKLNDGEDIPREHLAERLAQALNEGLYVKDEDEAKKILKEHKDKMVWQTQNEKAMIETGNIDEYLNEKKEKTTEAIPSHRTVRRISR